MPKLLDVRETADALHIQESTVRAWIIRNKYLDVVKVGRAVRVTAESVERLILQNTRQAGTSTNRADDTAEAQ